VKTTPSPDEPPAPADVAALMSLGVRLAHRLAWDKGLSYHADELCGVAMEALARAIVGYKPDVGPLKPYGVVWMAWEIKHAIQAEHARRQHEVLVEDVAAGHPTLAAEDLAESAADALLLIYVDDALRGQGDAGLLTQVAAAELRREVETLDARDRQLLALLYWEERGWEEVGAALGVNKRTAQKWHVRICEHLRDRLGTWNRVRPLPLGRRR
jgi:RNA polymerase sigma factor (sigma-70 family)